MEHIETRAHVQTPMLCLNFLSLEEQSDERERKGGDFKQICVVITDVAGTRCAANTNLYVSLLGRWCEWRPCPCIVFASSGEDP